MIKLSKSDLILLQKAQEGVRRSQAIFQFVSEHLNDIYEIPPMSPIDMKTGKVLKPKVPNGS